MKIENMVIKNFKSIESKELSLQKMTVLLGKNGAGKSSTLEAIRYLLTGKLPPSPVRFGSDNACVSAELFGSLIKRITEKGVWLDGKKTSQSSIAAFLESATGVNQQTMQVATSAEILASMEGGDLAEFLVTSGLIPAAVDLKTLKSICSITADAEAELVKKMPASGVFMLEEIADIYSEFFALRKAAKANLSAKKALAVFEGDPPKRTLAQLDKDEEEFHAHDAKQNAYLALMKSYERDEARIADITKQVAALESALVGKKVAPVDPNELVFLHNKESEWRKKSADLALTEQTLTANIAMFQRTLDNLDKPVCPISAKLVCTTDKTAIREELTQMIRANDEELVKAQKQRADVESNLGSVLSKIEDYRKREQEYRSYVTTCERRDALRASLPTLPAKPVKPAEIPDVAKRKAELKSERELIVRYNESQKAYDECLELAHMVEVYDELVTLLSPKSGIREKIISQALEAIVDHCNSRSAILRPNFSITMKVDKGVRILCSPDITALDYLPLESVSSGEQVYVMLLILDALNVLSGLGIMLLDDLDKLDKEALTALFELLSNPEITDPYDHIVLAMVNHEDSMEVVNRYKAIIDEVIFV